MAELSSYPPVTTLAGTERIPVITTPGIAGGNKYITATNLATAIGGSMSAAAILAALITVDGAGSGLDADTLDGLSSAAFIPASTVLFVQSVGTDQTSVMTTAINALPATGGRVAIPAGEFYSRIAISGHSNLTFSGAGAGSTTLIGPTTAAMVSVVGSPRGRYTFEDMTIDLGLAIGFMTIYPDDGQVTFRRCLFINATDYCVSPQGAIDPVFEDTVFQGNGSGSAAGSAVTCGAGVRGLRWIRSKCLYMSSGITFDASPHDNIDIDGGVFDGGWYLLKTRSGGYTNSGGTVTYSATVLTDTAAAFGAIPTPYDVNVRALPVLESGAASATYFNTYVNDSTATFITATVQPGHLVRVSGKFAVVTQVVSETRLYVEGWIDSTTYYQTAPPADATAYTVHRLFTGLVVSNTATTITIDRWIDFVDGASVTPAAGTLYEVLVNHGEYSGIHAAAATPYGPGAIRRINIHGGARFTRTWNDQVSIYGSDARVEIDSTVLVEHGQDFGVTCHGDEARIACRAIHNGAVGVLADGPDSRVEAFASGSPWVNNANTEFLGDIVISGSRTRATGSVVVAAGAYARYGIVVNGFAADGVVSDVDLSGTTAHGYSVGEYRLNADAAAGVTGTILHDVSGVISTNNATGTITDLSTAQMLTEYICVALSDETTAITTGTAKATIRMPFAMTVTAVRASVNTVSSSGLPTVDINDGGTTILSTKLTIDASEKTSTTAATPAVISDSALADDAEITFDIDVAGTGAKGLKVWIIGTRAA